MNTNKHHHRKALALAIVMLLTLLPGVQHLPAPGALAAGEYGYTGPTGGRFLAPIAPPASGSTPISTRAELEAVNDWLTGSFHLTNDIDLSGADWEPIMRKNSNGTTTPFQGTFDGQGYIIRNMKITGDNPNAGLFGCMISNSFLGGATVKNLGLEGTVINVSSSYPVVFAGGIVGNNYDENTIENCYNTGSIYASGDYPKQNLSVGGICGSDYDSKLTIKNCYNTASISAVASRDKPTYAGGICGNGPLTVENCYNTGNIYASSPNYSAQPNQYAGCTSSAGGILGVATKTIKNCYNTGNVSAGSPSYVGPSAGGICGRGYSEAVLTSCYSTGNISAFITYNAPSDLGYSADAGGICGLTSNLPAKGAYWSIDSTQTAGGAAQSPKRGIGSGTGTTTSLTTAQMKQQASFTGFDFDNIWGIDPLINNGYPFLQKISTVIQPTPTPTPDGSTPAPVTPTPGGGTPVPVTPTPHPGPYTVTFVAEGGSLPVTVPQAQSVLYGNLVTNPGNPLNYQQRWEAFLGWYSDWHRTVKWDFTKDTVKGNMTLYAKLVDSDGADIDYTQPPIVVQGYQVKGATSINSSADIGEDENTGIVTTWEIVQGLAIDLSSEAIQLPEGYTIKSYSVDGGNRWKTIKNDQQNMGHNKNPFNTRTSDKQKNNFAKILGKDLSLRLSDEAIEKGTKKPPANARILAFPNISKRAKFPKTQINYTYGADWTGKTSGKWLVLKKDGKALIPPRESKKELEVGISGADNKKVVNENGFGKFWECGHEGDCSDDVFSATQCNGYSVKNKDITREISYFIRKAPQEHIAPDGSKTYTAASKIKRILNTNNVGSVKGIPKKPNYKSKAGAVKLKKGDMIFAGSLNELEASGIAAPTLTPADKNAAVAIEPGQLLFARDAKVTVTLPEGIKDVTVWKAPTLKKPQSEIGPLS
ncbi:MAG: InlB B-repeat-containing protein [Oscillospiraceae bacterium]|nr:InlB B-repeat-containing protein [Oscillospiraceae bacterium]